MANTNDDSNDGTDFTAQLKERLGNPAIFVLVLAGLSTYRRELYELFLVSNDRADYVEALAKITLFNPDLWMIWTGMLIVYYGGVYFGGLLSAFGEKLKRHAAISMVRYTPLPVGDRRVLEERISQLQASREALAEEFNASKNAYSRMIDSIFTASLRGKEAYTIQTFFNVSVDRDLMILDLDSNKFVTDQPLPVSREIYVPYLVLFKTTNSFVGMRLEFSRNRININSQWLAGEIEIGRHLLAKQFDFNSGCNDLYMPNTIDCKWQQDVPTDTPYLVLTRAGTQITDTVVRLSIKNMPGRFLNSP